MANKNDTKDLQALLKKYQQGVCSTEELHLLKKLYEARQELPDYELTSEKRSVLKMEMLEKINKAIDAGNRKQSSRLWLKVAVWALLIVAGGWLISTMGWSDEISPIATISKKTLAGQKLIVMLPDGSKVHLNAQSEIRYPSQFGETRDIELFGEAFFEVKRDPSHPFTVMTGGMNTRVLGTSFNVKAYQEDKAFEVIVATGKVNVSAASQSVDLLPGEQVSYSVTNSEMGGKGKMDKYGLSWREGILALDGNSMEEALQLLERWYGVTVDNQLSSGKSSCELTISFKRLSLEEIMNQLEIITGIRYEFVDSHHVKIYGKACE